MEKVTACYEDGIFTVSLAGHIDSANAGEVEEKITALRAENPEGKFVIDADYLEYISSAGLRIILRLFKKERTLKITNASTQVYEVFETTGFTDMLPIEKARRRVSIDGCEILGRGSNGTVYRLDPETIVKIYHDPNAFGDMERERDIAKKAFILGIPTAIPYDIVRVGNTYGAVFECLHAKSITKLVKAEPEKIEEHIKTFVELMKLIHSTECEPCIMPDIRKTVIDWVEFLRGHLPEDQWQKLHDLVAAVPEHNFVIHGDYHTNNVLVQDGETILIDMDTLSIGHPIFELASMYNAFIGFGSCNPQVIMDFMGLPMETTQKIWKKSLALYLENNDDEFVSSVEKKAQLLGYTRLLRRSIKRLSGTKDGEEFIAYCKKRIAELLPEVDTLTF